MPASIALIYFSATGNTARLAEAVGQGARGTVEVFEFRITGADIVNGRFRNEAAMALVDGAAAVIFGSPTFMGGPAAEFKAFADATSARWGGQRWRNKVAAGFTTGSCANGDQGHTLTYFTVLAAQHGMLWCGLDLPGGAGADGTNRWGAQTGVVSQAVDGVLDARDLATAKYLGQRVASLAAQLAAMGPPQLGL